ncbi:MAG: PEP-CTERM sorting domain-containing protein [Planctomycetota bacterium]
MDIQIQATEGGLRADFHGDFIFDYIPADVTSMLFPVPPDADNIAASMDGVPLEWYWSNDLYPTILPEMPTIPMIKWDEPFPTEGAVFAVDYEHDLIERPDEYIFFYALGTGKYFPTYDKTTTANFDILLPEGFDVGGVWLDETPHDYEVVNGHLMVTVESHFGPIVNDLIVSLVPEPSTLLLLGLGGLALGSRKMREVK